MMAVHGRWPRSHCSGLRAGATLLHSQHHRTLTDARFLKSGWPFQHLPPPSIELSPPCPSDHMLNERYVTDESPSPWQPEATSLSNSSASLIGDDVGSSPPLQKGSDINCNVVSHHDKQQVVEHAVVHGSGRITAEAARRRMTSNGLHDSRAEVSSSSSTLQQQQSSSSSPPSSSSSSVAWRPAAQSPPSRPSSHRLTPNSNNRQPPPHLTPQEQAHLMLQGVGPSSLFRPPHSSPAAAADSRHFPLLYPTSTGSSNTLYHQSLYMHQGQAPSQLTLSPYAPFHYGPSSTGYPSSSAGALLHGFPHDSYSTLLTRFNTRGPFHPGAVPAQYPLPPGGSSGSPGPLPRLPTPSQPAPLPPNSNSGGGLHLGPQERHPAARSPKHELHANSHRGQGSPAANKFAQHPSLLKQPSYKPHHHPKDETNRDSKASCKDSSPSCSDERYKIKEGAPPSAKRPRLQQQHHPGGIGQPPPLTRNVPHMLPPPPPLQPTTGEVTPHYPPHFNKGSVIQLANGELRRVEELRTEDFVQSADVSCDLKIDSSTVVRIEENHDKGTAVLGFSVGEQRVQVTVEATLEHPFFVFGQGWSSCNPQQTFQRYGLQCHRLTVGDVCISLTHKDTSAASPSGGSTDPKDKSPKKPPPLPKHTEASSSPSSSRPARASSAGATGRGVKRLSPGLFRNCPASSPTTPSSSPPRRRWSAPDHLADDAKCRASMKPLLSSLALSRGAGGNSRPEG